VCLSLRCLGGFVGLFLEMSARSTDSLRSYRICYSVLVAEVALFSGFVILFLEERKDSCLSFRSFLRSRLKDQTLATRRNELIH
jgi:hypothetical protein